MKDDELLQEIAELRDLVAGLIAPGDANLKVVVEELRRVQKVAKELEKELLNRVLANVERAGRG